MAFTSRAPFGIRRQITAGLLLALVFCVGVSSLNAGERIWGYIDRRGKVVFVNDPVPAQDALESPAPTNLTGTHPSESQSHIDNLIERAASQHRLDPELVRAIVRVESNYNPYAVSPRGARGLMQLIPATARRFGVLDIFDPEANLDGGIRYLKYLLELFDGDLQLSLAAYNAGENAVGRTRSVPAIPETRNYLRKIAAIYPLRPPLRPPTRVAGGVTKFVDARGVVHISNTD